MSLIHKALKKAEGDDRAPGAEPPIESFIGEKLKGLKSQLPPRTIVLLVLALLAMIFMIYKKFYHKSTTFPPAHVTAPAVERQMQGEPQTGTLAVPVVIPSNASVEMLITDGKKLYEGEKYDDALAKFLEADVKNPNDPVVFNNIGLVYKKKNDLSRAEAFYKKALVVKPNYPECLNNLGVLKGAGGDPLEAAVYLKKAISAEPTYPDAYFNLGVLNDGEGNFREAISNYKLFLQYTASTDESLINKVKERIEQLSE